jgi:LDH2 family malate/lactate/ureidoglycolate dehydrogenase
MGHFFGALRVDAFRPADEFKEHMDQWIRRFRSAEPTAGNEKVLIPGDPERELEIIRKKEGIPLHDSVVQDLNDLGKKFGVTF